MTASEPPAGATEHCMVCGSVLEYLEAAHESVCAYCGKTEHGHIRCPNGHYLCDRCHNKDAVEIIRDVAFTAQSKNPVDVAGLMMGYPGLPMLGCQHAYIAGGAFMAALRNEGSRGITNEDIEEVFRRTEKQAHGGYCGLTGVCGIAPALGACFAVLTGSRCGTDDEQRATMELVTRISRAIADLTGPSCCKAYVWASLAVAVDYLKENFGITLDSEPVTACGYSLRHPHGCRQMKCPYFADGRPLYGSLLNQHITSSVVGSQKGEGTGGDALDHLVVRALELGAERAKIIDTASVCVEEWVRWKCRYGCPLFDKDAYHPPCAPGAESTKKVLREFRKAILMNSSKGKPLTEAAVKLEGEAYRKGYYKAFALTALSSGPEGAS